MRNKTKSIFLLVSGLLAAALISVSSGVKPAVAACPDPYDCPCYSWPNNPDPMICGEFGDESCDTNDCSCGDDCDECYGSSDPCCGSTDECCGSEDPCCGSIDECCGSEDPCCGLQGKDLTCCTTPDDPICSGDEKCDGKPKPSGDGPFECCTGNSVTGNGAKWCDTSNGASCKDRRVCDPGGDNGPSANGSCSGTDNVCQVAIVHSCSITMGTDEFGNPTVERDTCKSGGGGGDPTVCTYDFDYDGTVGCDGVTRPAGGGTVNITDQIPGDVVCPPADDYAAAAAVAIAQALQNAGHPVDNNGAAAGCGCEAGTIECDGQCIPDTEECCPDGSIPDPVFGCVICGPGEKNCNGACIPDTETCCPVGTFPDPVTRECITCGTGRWFCPLQQRCILDTECCDPNNFQYCLNRGECIPKTECCDPTHVACPTCRPAAECVDLCLGQATGGEYCAEVVAEGGAKNYPWSSKDDASLDAFFASSTAGQSFSQVKAAQALARADGDPATVEMPVVGRVTPLVGGGSCQAQICDHGQECALYVGVNGKTSAACVGTVCDVCDQDLPACDPENPVDGECCYDAAKCGCNPILDPFRCCENDPAETGVPLGDSQCVLPPRGVAIEVLPNLIDTSGDGGTCFVLWASQGMASTTVAGEGMDAGPNLDLRHLSAGIAAVSGVKTSTLFKITGQGVDGKTYEATDLCATNPNIGEF